LNFLKSVYGFFDTPQAWWKETIQFLVGLAFVHNRLDPALMSKHQADTGASEVFVILHADVFIDTHHRLQGTGQSWE
jgi:hypothetical protein